MLMRPFVCGVLKAAPGRPLLLACLFLVSGAQRQPATLFALEVQRTPGFSLTPFCDT